MKNSLLSTGLQILSASLRMTNLGHGSTWPGHIALKINPYFIEEIITEKNIVPIVVAGTNGKTTTSKMLQTILEKAKINVFQNESGANLLNGIASSLILHSGQLSPEGKTYAVFEVDENALPHLLKQITPAYIILLNLFRDQLDRYGEVHTIAKKWREGLEGCDQSVEIIANGDDPQIVGICEGLEQTTQYFGLEDGKKTETEHAADSIYCPKCGTKLTYKSVQFSHLGDWKCPSCGFKRPKVFSEKIPLHLLGSYNAYNALAALLTAQKLGIKKKTILDGLLRVSPAFGRQESFEKDGKQIIVFLSKNPTGMNESLRTINELGGKHLLFLLNDKIPDGTDVSWIWDVDIEELVREDANVAASGDRACDMGLRLKYAGKWKTDNLVDANLKNSIESSLVNTTPGETLYIVTTYSAMLEARKLLTGRGIL